MELRSVLFFVGIVVSLVVVVGCGDVFGDDAVRGDGLKTVWSKEVVPERVHSDYPRPTLVRRDWLNLNGYWDWKRGEVPVMPVAGRATIISTAKNPSSNTPDSPPSGSLLENFQIDQSLNKSLTPEKNLPEKNSSDKNLPEKISPDKNLPDKKTNVAGEQFTGQVLVPFPIESSLSGVGKSFDRVVYRRYFKVPQAWGADRRILLHFGAVDWESVVYLNGQMVGRHQGGFDSFSFDVTNYLKISRDDVNELLVYVYDPANLGHQPRGKQSVNPSGILYTSVSGIWQTVWLEPVSKSYVKHLNFSTDIDNGVLTIRPVIENPAAELSLRFEAYDGDDLVVEAFGGVDGRTMLKFPADKLKLWHPDSPFLYQVRVQLFDRTELVDQVVCYVAFRKIDMAKNAQGRMRIRLNKKFLFLMGVIDQGYWPDGLYTPPCDNAIKSDIMTAKSLGFNMIRKHVKVESERWYYWCDRVGMLVWQDMPSGDNRTDESKKIFRQELQQMIQGNSNHPSIIIWSLFNEGWGQHRTAEYVRFCRQLDGSRLINAASGWNDVGVGDLNDNHKFPGPELPEMDAVRCGVIGSFGGVTLVSAKEHLWTTETWGYSHAKDSETLLTKYRRMHDDLKKMIESGLSAAVFHQLTDIESECNGIITYDRALLKMPANEIKKININTIKYGSAE
ncbi:MAG: hypothetical protein LBQ66_04170 [Planctomycetaceae bacterium]|jgi:hypothetical protein|nr:hypothetical protein [Planctomycetaceae bacterium]